MNINGHVDVAYSPPTFPANSGDFKGKFWYQLADDGGIIGSTFIPGTNSFEDRDYGFSIGIGKKFQLGNMKFITIQVIDHLSLGRVYNDEIP